MLDRVRLYGAHHMADLTVEMHPTLNVLIGTNGSGKTRALDAIYGAISRSRQGVAHVDAPLAEHMGRVEIVANYRERPTDRSGHRPYVYREPIMYVGADGRYLVSCTPYGYLSDVQLTQDEVLFGVDRTTEGVFRDLSDGQLSPAWGKEYGAAIAAALDHLGLPMDEPVRRVGDPRTYPTVRLNGRKTMMLHAPRSIQRMTSIVYLLVWTWHEHLIAADIEGAEPAGRMVALVDEPEQHLHVDAQRLLIDALNLATEMLGIRNHIQWVFATHSPTFLASVDCEWERDGEGLHDLSAD